MKMTRRVFMLLLTMVMCLLLGTSAFADGYRPEGDMEPVQVGMEENLWKDEDAIPFVNYLNFTYNDWDSTNGWFTADIVLLYNETYDRFERLVSFENFDSDYYRNIIIKSQSCTFSNGKQTATITVNYTAQDIKTNEVESGTTTFVVTVND